MSSCVFQIFQPSTTASHLLVLCADAGAGGTDLTGWALEFGVVALADAAFTFTTAVTFLSILSETGGNLHGAVAGAARVVGVTDALPAFTASVSC